MILHNNFDLNYWRQCYYDLAIYYSSVYLHFFSFDWSVKTSYFSGLILCIKMDVFCFVIAARLWNNFQAHHKVLCKQNYQNAYDICISKYILSSIYHVHHDVTYHLSQLSHACMKVPNGYKFAWGWVCLDKGWVRVGMGTHRLGARLLGYGCEFVWEQVWNLHGYDFTSAWVINVDLVQSREKGLAGLGEWESGRQ